MHEWKTFYEYENSSFRLFLLPVSSSADVSASIAVAYLGWFDSASKSS